MVTGSSGLGDRNAGRTPWVRCGDKKVPAGNGGWRRGGTATSWRHLGTSRIPNSRLPSQIPVPKAPGTSSAFHTELYSHARWGGRNPPPLPSPPNYRIRRPLGGTPKSNPPFVGGGGKENSRKNSRGNSQDLEGKPGKIPWREGRVRPFNSGFKSFFFFQTIFFILFFLIPYFFNNNNK